MQETTIVTEMKNFTPLEEIYQIFLNSLSNDYRIRRMYDNIPELADSLLKTWLIKAIANFIDCRKNLDIIDYTCPESFSDCLDIREKVILAELMEIEWMDWNINNITQMNLSLQDSDFKTHAASQNLTAKLEYADKKREKVYHLMSEYTKEEYPISKWATGDI